MTSFSLFLGVQSAPEVGATSYEILCIYIYIRAMASSFCTLLETTQRKLFTESRNHSC